MAPTKLGNLIANRRVVICAGPGGVGKTTTAASLGVMAARTGRATLVATIDPAPRLVDALSMPDLGPSPAVIPESVAKELGVGACEHLLATRIDPGQAFDALVTEHLSDTQARERILSNPIYRQVTTTLTGAQEFAAMLALYRFHHDPRHQLVVLDTPPTSNALEFFDAPARINAAIESPVIRWLLADGRHKDQRLFSLRRLSSGGALVLRGLARLVGSRFLNDLSGFLSDFEPVLEGFLDRARAIDGLLHEPEVAVVLVSAPEPPAIDETLQFAERLGRINLFPSAFVVNRVLPRPGLNDADALRTTLQKVGALAPLPPATLDEAAVILHQTAAALGPITRNQDRQIARLHAAYPTCPVITIPLIETDNNSLSVLQRTAGYLARDTAG